jgi:ABC-type sugar transport system substrate-binding protein
MKSLKAKVALVALVTAAAGGVLAAPAYAAAGPNTGGANCHGVWLSYLSTSGMSPGQLQKDFGTSVQDVQATADAVCGL